MLDQIDICDLVARERQSRVTHNTDVLESCYFPDATAITSWTGGRVPIQEYLHGGKAPVNDPECPIVSRIGYPVVHLNGNRAYVELPQITLRWNNFKGEKALLTSYMRLIYLVEKREDCWKIVDFSSIYESDTLEPAVPGHTLDIDEKQVMQYRHPYRYMAYVDGDVCPTLLGIDQPDEVKSAYEGFENWIHEENKEA